MRIWKVLPALSEHIPAVAVGMREADRREAWASHRHQPVEALEYSLSRSELAWTCLVCDIPAFMWGVARTGSMISEKGSPWLLGTDDIKRVTNEFLRQSRQYIDFMQGRFPRLENYVHTENRMSIRWLKWCGFAIEEKPMPINGEEFYLFWRNGNV